MISLSKLKSLISSTQVKNEGYCQIVGDEIHVLSEIGHVIVNMDSVVCLPDGVYQSEILFQLLALVIEQGDKAIIDVENMVIKVGSASYGIIQTNFQIKELPTLPFKVDYEVDRVVLKNYLTYFLKLLVKNDINSFIVFLSDRLISTNKRVFVEQMFDWAVKVGAEDRLLMLQRTQSKLLKDFLDLKLATRKSLKKKNDEANITDNVAFINSDDYLEVHAPHGILCLYLTPMLGISLDKLLTIFEEEKEIKLAADFMDRISQIASFAPDNITYQATKSQITYRQDEDLVLTKERGEEDKDLTEISFRLNTKVLSQALDILKKNKIQPTFYSDGTNLIFHQKDGLF